MSEEKRLKANKKRYKQLLQITSIVSNRLLLSLIVIGRRARRANRRARIFSSGFVLPTVAMVIMVVVLLTTAIMLRSFDRSKNASNVRVNQVVFNAAAPALDRAKSKIEDVLAKLVGSIPSDNDLYTYFSNNSNKTYTLGDETQLEVVVDFGNGQDVAPGSSPPQPDGKLESLSNQLASSLNNDETVTTAWKFPVDTDNNGLFDSYTLYGIYYRSPSRDPTTENFNRPRTALNARTPPMSGGTISTQCPSATGTSASLIGNSSWYKTGANLAKSFFVYTATVPITHPPTNPPVGIPSQYEKYTGNKGFLALEYQQDRVRIPLTNNAVVYKNDVEITPGPTFRLNGRIVTNSNLLLGNFSNGVFLYQVSSQYSCYYQEENSRIIVGGNVAAAGIIDGFPDNNYQPVNVSRSQTFSQRANNCKFCS